MCVSCVCGHGVCGLVSAGRAGLRKQVPDTHVTVSACTRKTRKKLMVGGRFVRTGDVLIHSLGRPVTAGMVVCTTVVVAWDVSVHTASCTCVRRLNKSGHTCVIEVGTWTPARHQSQPCIRPGDGWASGFLEVRGMPTEPHLAMLAHPALPSALTLF